MKQKCIFLCAITGIFSVLIILSGCSNQATTVSNESNIYDETEQLLLESAQLTDDKISKLSLDYSEIEDFGDYYKFFCESDEKSYEGMAILSDGKVIKIDLAELDTQSAFTVHTFSGAIKNDDESKSLFFACSGTINDNNVKKLHIFLSGRLMYEVQIGDRNTYNIVIADNQPTILKIDALDEKDSVIFSYPPYPPKNIT